MSKTSAWDYSRPVFIFFIFINSFCLIFPDWLDAKKIDHKALLIGNFILFLLTLIACFIHVRALKNNNPFAFVRAVTVASFLKLIIIALSVFIYFNIAESPSVYAVAISMVLYIVYTIFEVRGAMKLNRERNAKN